MIGCFLGGLLGASAALLMPKKFWNGINGVNVKLAKGAHHHNNQQKDVEAHTSVKSFAVKKSKPRKPVKRAKGNM